MRYTISWYARRAYASNVDVDSSIPAFSIKTSAGTETDGVTTIPVAAGSTIEFSTSLVDTDKSYVYAWYFTNSPNFVLDINSVYTVDPTRDESFPAEGTIACVVSDGKGNWGSAVFPFELTAAQSPIILYNNETDDAGYISRFSLGLAAFDEITENQTIENSLLDGAIRDFCFDSDYNLYAVTKVDSSYSIVKYKYSLLNGYSLDEEESLPVSQSEINAISCDTTNGYIFYLSGGTIYVYDPSNGTKYTLRVSVDVEDVSNLFTQTEGVTYETAIKNIAASNGALYIAMDVTQTGSEVTETAQIIARYTYSAPDESDESITPAWDNRYVAVEASEVFKDASTVAVTVNDMMVQDSKLYVLVSQQEGSSSSSVTHRGALLTITDNNGSLTLTTYGANDNNYAKKALDKDEKTFYAPQKFLAVMPKKLVIADEGFWIDESNNYGVINRVVTVDLAEDVKDYSSEAVNVNVSFDLNISISACGSLYVDVK